MTEGEAQTALAEIALELVAITDRLQRIHDELPEAPNREAMWAHEIPRDVATETDGLLDDLVLEPTRRPYRRQRIHNEQSPSRIPKRPGCTRARASGCSLDLPHSHA